MWRWRATEQQAVWAAVVVMLAPVVVVVPAVPEAPVLPNRVVRGATADHLAWPEMLRSAALVLSVVWRKAELFTARF